MHRVVHIRTGAIRDVTEPQSDRFQILLVAAFLLFVAAGVYLANQRSNETSLFQLGRNIATEKPSNKQKRPTPANVHGGNPPRMAKGQHTASKPLSERQTTEQYERASRMCDRSARQPAATSDIEHTRLQEVAAILQRAAVDQTMALSRLREMEQNSLAKSYLAYFTVENDNTANVDELLLNARLDLKSSLCVKSFTLLDHLDSPLLSSLIVLRFAVEDALETANASIIYCDIFLSHPREAVLAFSELWSTERDRIGVEVKRYCARELLGRFSSDTSSRVDRALSELSESLGRIKPMSRSITGDSTYTSAATFVVDTLLGGTDDNLDSAENDADYRSKQGERSEIASEQLVEYRTLADYHVTAIGEGICLLQQARSLRTSAENCQKRATYAVRKSLADWLKPR